MDELGIALQQLGPDLDPVANMIAINPDAETVVTDVSEGDDVPDLIENMNSLLALHGEDIFIYQRIHGVDTRYDLPGEYARLSLASEPSLEGVRCIGNRPQPGITTPRMHHKFLVFSEVVMTCPADCRSPRDERDQLCPYAHDHAWNPLFVWTGSYNITASGANSWENSLIIRNPVIAQAYLDEWRQLLALSEPLDWDSPCIHPQWSFGT